MERVRRGYGCTQWMILGWSLVMMFCVYSLGKYMVLLFIDSSETEVIQAAVTYFKVAAWCYPFWAVFSVPKYTAGNGIWIGSHVGRRI